MGTFGVQITEDQSSVQTEGTFVKKESAPEILLLLKISLTIYLSDKCQGRVSLLIQFLVCRYSSALPIFKSSNLG